MVEAVLVISRSADAGVTAVASWNVLLAVFGSGCEPDPSTRTVLVSVVPTTGIVWATLTVRVTTLDAPDASEVIEQVMLPPENELQLVPPGAAIRAKVVLGGMVSDTK